MRRVLKSAGCCLMMILGLQGMAFGFSAAYDNDLPDARSIGNSGAVAARADSPVTNWYNPAGLTDVKGTQLSVTGMVETVRSNFTVDDRKINARSDIFYLPTMFYSTHLNEKLAFGLGVHSPYGLVTEWDDPLTNYVTTKAELKTMNVNPNIAYKINEQWSIAAGVNVQYTLGDLNKLINQTALNTSLLYATTGVMSVVPYSDAEFRMEGSGVCVAGNVALLYKPTEKWNLGLSYRDTMTTDVSGKLYLKKLDGITALSFGGAEYETAASAIVQTPANLTAGIAYHWTPKTTVELDLNYAMWSAVDNLNVTTRGETDPVRLLVLTTGNPIERDWKDTLNIAVAIEHMLNDKYTVFAGTRYRPSPIPERTADPSVPFLDLIDLEGGFTVKLSESDQIDFSLAYVYGKERTIDNAVGNSVGASVDGKYKMKAYVVGVTYTKKY